MRRIERFIDRGQIYGGLRSTKLFTLVAVYTIYFKAYSARIITSLFVITVKIDSDAFFKGDAVHFLSCRNSILGNV